MTKTNMVDSWDDETENGDAVGEELYNGNSPQTAASNDGILHAIDRRLDLTPLEINELTADTSPVPLSSYVTVLNTNAGAFSYSITGIKILVDTDTWASAISAGNTNIKLVMVHDAADYDLISALQLADLQWGESHDVNFTVASPGTYTGNYIEVFIPLGITLEATDSIKMETVAGSGTDLFGTLDASVVVYTTG